MDLFGALSTAFNGLNQTQDALSVVSQNVAGASQPGYVRREYVGDTSSGVGPTVKRTLDSYVQKQLWSETSSSGYASIQADYANQLNALYGDPNSTSNLSSNFDALTNALTSLQSNPTGQGEQSAVLTAASTLAQQVNTTSNGIQNLRSSSEDAISQSVTDANNLLQQLASLNTQISAAPGANNLDLQDSRDAALSQLSNLMTVAVTQNPDGTVDLATRNGLSLLSGGTPATLGFNAHSNLSATSLYSTDASQSGVGTITLTSGGRTTDLLASGTPIGGQIGGLVDLRDNVLVQAQSQLDDFAAGVSQALSNREVSSSPVAGGLSIDTTGLQRGNRISLSYVDNNGVSHQATIIRVDDASQLPLPNTATGDPNDQVIGVSFANGTANAATAVQSALNSLGQGVTVSASSATPPTNELTFTAASPASVSTLSASVTNTQLQGQGAALPMFADSATGSPYTGSFDGGSKRAGYAQRIEVNPALQKLPSALTDATGTSSSGDTTRINALVSQLSTQPINMSTQSGIPYSNNMTAGDYVKQVLQTQANTTNQLTTLSNSQSVVLSSVQSRFNQGASVNMDEELTNLTALQNVYAANAKVMTAVRDMFTVLMQM